MNQEAFYTKQYKQEKKKLLQDYEEKISNINAIIKKEEKEKNILSKELSDQKESLMSENDNLIAKKRFDLEKLRIEYDRVEKEFEKVKQELNNDIHSKRQEVKRYEEDKKTYLTTLMTTEDEINKISKEIAEYINEQKDKEQTIKEKNEIERNLFKENQELEKFKFVLNYKIKELQHQKDPKENKLQHLEKQAKDMDREIKNFEFAQRNYLIELTTNNEIMNLHEKQIVECEKGIEKLKHYKKLFMQALYQANKKATNPKQIKKRIVELKGWFLDKEYIDHLEKTNEDSDYETQREFLEENNKNNKDKIRSTQKLHNQDHEKLMREEKDLIRNVNYLKREQHEIKLKDFNNLEQKDYSMRGKSKNKETVPVFSNGSSHINQKEKNVKNQLYEIEKEIAIVNNKKREIKKLMEKLTNLNMKKKNLKK